MAFLEIEYRRRLGEWNMAKLQAHGYYEIYYLLSGKRSVIVNDRIFNLEAGAVMIIPPYALHKTEGGAYERVNVYIDPELLDEREKKFLRDCAATTAIMPTGAGGRLLRSVLEEYIGAVGEGDSALKQKYDLHFAKLLLFALQTAALSPLAATAAPSAKREDRELVLSIVSYINSHLEEEITLEDIMRRHFLSKNTLCRVFRRVMDCSVIEYCSAARLNKAKQLLLTTDLEIGEIAHACGYSSANYFSLIFKKKAGISPMNYRKKN